MFRLKSISPKFSNLTYAWAAIVVVWSFLFIRLYDLQVQNRQVYMVKSEENRIVRLMKIAARGEILDRNGRILSASRFSVDLVAPNRRLKSRALAELCQTLSPMVDVPSDRLRDAYISNLRKTYSYQAVPILKNMTNLQTVRVGENLWRLPDIRLEKRLTRWYPAGQVLSHVLGYVNEVSKEDMEEDPARRLGGMIGRAGIEEILDPYLRGKDGWDWVEVDVHGRLRRILKHLPAADPEAGAAVRLTLDLAVSRAFEDAFGDSNGFGILMDAQTGAIRAMFSRPNFDPNRLVAADLQYIRRLQTSPDHPFFNRAVQSAFPPGSTFKTVNFIAASEAGLADEHTRFYCSGRFYLGKRMAECWKSQGHGWIALQPALTHSCNIFFYNLGLKLGGELMTAAGRIFRLGEKTGIILSGEPSGILPDAAWKAQRTGEPWSRGDDVNMSIGQGFLLVTPLQQVTLMASLFNGGRLFRPHLVESVKNSAGDTVFSEEPEIRNVVRIGDTTLALLLPALREVVVRGTGYRAGHDVRYRAYPVDVYGKTGTVQRAGRDAVEKAGVEPEDHGWFLCHFELLGEKYTAVVMKESAGHGGTVAAPVIGRFIERMIGWKT